MRILLTTTSYQDTPGAHHDLLNGSGLEIVRARGPLSESDMLELISEQGPFEGTLNGDDAFTPKVIDALLPQCRCLSKYGIGLDKIDVAHCTSKRLPVLFTPGVNHTTVAEHAVGLMVAVAKHFWLHTSHVKQGRWTRQTGKELMGKTLGVLGMGRIGKEVIVRAAAFGMKTIAFDMFWDDAFAAEHGVERADSPQAVLQRAEVLSLHLPMNEQTTGYLNSERIALMPDGAIVVNTARGGLIDEAAVAESCRSGKLYGYGTDVLDAEPIEAPHPFKEIDNIIITPHVGSRTFESVERQALRATNNLINFLNGNEDYIQANELE